MTDKQLERACALRRSMNDIDNALNCISGNYAITLKFSKTGVVPSELIIESNELRSVKDAIKQELTLVLGKLVDEFENL